MIRWEVGRNIFDCAGSKVTMFLKYTDEGSGFVYGDQLVKIVPTFAFEVSAWIWRRLLIFCSFLAGIKCYFLRGVPCENFVLLRDRPKGRHWFGNGSAEDHWDDDMRKCLCSCQYVLRNGKKLQFFLHFRLFF